VSECARVCRLQSGAALTEFEALDSGSGTCVSTGIAAACCVSRCAVSRILQPTSLAH